VLNNPTNFTDPLGLAGDFPHFQDAVDVQIGCGIQFGPCFYADGFQISATKAAELIGNGWAAAVPPGISPTGLVNGYYYEIKYTGNSDYPQLSYPGLSDAQVETLVAQGKIPGHIPVDLIRPEGALPYRATVVLPAAGKMAAPVASPWMPVAWYGAAGTTGAVGLAGVYGYEAVGGGPALYNLGTRMIVGAGMEQANMPPPPPSAVPESIGYWVAWWLHD
jgi:hypothetical protein